jgi:hypothetical protein
MPVLVPGRPVEQREPVLVVQNRFEPGVHRFSLVVVDDSGIESEPDVIAVTLRRAIVVEPVRPPIVDTRIDVPVRPPIDPVVTPVINPAVINPVVTHPVIRPRGAVRKGKKHGPE